MTPFDHDNADLLSAARARGTQMLGSTALPVGLDQFTVYAGLIGSALELAKLVQTEQRDMTVIHHHYEISVTQIRAAFAEVEQAMKADFERDASVRDGTFEMMKLLIAAGQYEVASEMHKRLFDGGKQSSLETLLDHRNTIAGQSGGRLRLR